jgi:hypothetical protein
VSTVEIKDVGIPTTMQRAMARQAEAERERRAKVIHAEGEFQASGKLSQAAAILGQTPAAMQLRYLQTLKELGGERGSTVVFPLPLDLITPLMEKVTGKPLGAPAAAATPAVPEALTSEEQPALNGAPDDPLAGVLPSGLSSDTTSR